MLIVACEFLWVPRSKDIQSNVSRDKKQLLKRGMIVSVKKEKMVQRNEWSDCDDAASWLDVRFLSHVWTEVLFLNQVIAWIRNSILAY